MNTTKPRNVGPVLACSGEPATPSSQTRGFLHRLNTALSPAFGIVLPLGSQHIALHRFRRLDQSQQASGSCSQGASSKQAAHLAERPELLPGGAGCKQLLPQQFKQRLLEGIELAGPRRRRLLGSPSALPAGITAGRSGACSTLQLRPVPGTPTVVRAPPLRATGMLNEAPRPPTEIELSPPLAKLKRSGPRRVERRKRKTMAISGS